MTNNWFIFFNDEDIEVAVNKNYVVSVEADDSAIDPLLIVATITMANGKEYVTTLNGDEYDELLS